jgi:hypothetical protein
MKKSRILRGKDCFLAYYETDDDTFVAGFEGIKEIMHYRNLQDTKSNYDLVAIEVYRALKRKDGYTEMLGRPMHLHLIDCGPDCPDAESEAGGMDGTGHEENR